MTEREALIALNLASIGSIRLQRLLRFFGTPQEIFKQSCAALEAVSGIGEMSSRAILGASPELVEQEMRLAQKRGIRIIDWTESSYPAILKTIPDPPIVLYLKGALTDASSVAIVGSRRASMQGVRRARELASELARSGHTIVSGLARGIDTGAHQGALDAQGATIAVMGSGFSEVYPPENAELAERIAGQGAVISEYPMRMPPLPQNFPCRNRIISGLSAGTVIIEAARNSGALITADCALEQGRYVFAVPGAVEFRGAWGTNALIQQGAHVVLDARDITDIIGIHTVAGPAVSRPGAAGEDRHSPDEKAVWESLGSEPVTLDEIAEATGIGISRLTQALFSLQMKKEITQLPGKLFSRVH